MSDPESIREAGRWLRYATEDLMGAQRLIDDPATVPRLACVLAQRGTERL